jgi:hypothetical protein
VRETWGRAHRPESEALALLRQKYRDLHARPNRSERDRTLLETPQNRARFDGENCVRFGERLAKENALGHQHHESGRTKVNRTLILLVAKSWLRRELAFGLESDTMRDIAPADCGRAVNPACVRKANRSRDI